MSTTPHTRSPGRASGRELEERLAFLAIAMNDGLPRAQVVRLAMETFGVSRRMAQLYVKRIQARTGTLEFVMRTLTRMLRGQMRQMVRRLRELRRIALAQ